MSSYVACILDSKQLTRQPLDVDIYQHLWHDQITDVRHTHWFNVACYQSDPTNITACLSRYRCDVLLLHACIIYIYLYIYNSTPFSLTLRHFRWHWGVKIRITILKSMQYVAFLWDFSQITSNHQSNTKNNIYKYDFFKYEIYQFPWNSMEFHGNLWGKIINSMEFHGTREYGKSSMEFHGTLDLDKIPWNSIEFHGTWGFVAQVPWNSMEPEMLFKCCSKSSMELWRKFHGTFWSK